MQKKASYALLISTACGIAYAIHVSLLAGAIGAGYAAKQICSGVFVARLPEQFVVDTDVLPRLATVGPLAQFSTTNSTPTNDKLRHRCWAKP